jgi:hypothetical protein
VLAINRVYPWKSVLLIRDFKHRQPVMKYLFLLNYSYQLRYYQYSGSFQR